MQRIKLLKKLLPGFLPLIVFIIVDSFLGTKAGIVFAIAFGVIELIFIYLKEKRLDKFIIGDTLLLVIMGGVSLLLENDIFFKIKPAIIELIFCALIGFSAFSGKNLLLKMSQRYMKGVEMNELTENQFNRSLKILFWIFTVHVLLIFYAAFNMSNEAWGFISGVLFYLLFGVYMLFELIRNKLKFRKLKYEEWFPLVDEKGNIIGKAPRSVCHSGAMLLHPVVHVHIINKKGQIFLQKRSQTKDIQPGKWDTAVGGHIAFGEKLENAVKREVEEEAGIDAQSLGIKFQFLLSYVWKSNIETELVYVFRTFYDGEIKTDPVEIDDGKFWTIDEINKSKGQDVFTPNFEYELNNYGKLILSKIK